MRILNKRYWPAQVKIDYDDRSNSDTIKWCIKNFGHNRFRIVGPSTFYFTNQKDANWFALRWT